MPLFFHDDDPLLLLVGDARASTVIDAPSLAFEIGAQQLMQVFDFDLASPLTFYKRKV